MPILWVLAFGVMTLTGVRFAVLLTHGGTGTAVVGRSGSAWDTPASRAAYAVRGAGVRARSFSVAGSVGALFPGKTSPLVLVVTNPYKVAISVTSITTTVGGVSGHCGGANVKVTPFSGRLFVPAGKSGRAIVHVTLVHSAPDACQGAHFPFAFHGLATKT
jgi:hypothetical protein